MVVYDILQFILQPSKELLAKHYADLSKKPFFPGLVKFMATSPVACMVSRATSSFSLICVFQY